jgi:hypothetical protein
VQHHHARHFKRPPIDIAMELIVADMIKRDISVGIINARLAQPLKRSQ